MDYNKVSSIKNNVDEMIINKAKIEDNHISGEINVKEKWLPKKITIPYDKGFKLYVDGKRVGKVLTDKTFLGLEITKGAHKIDIKYNPPLLKSWSNNFSCRYFSYS
ncbi:MAG: YfhO family protein [Clostridium sp.]|nr:MAG: YfhO family protein [Clostridium sp.]